MVTKWIKWMYDKAKWNLIGLWRRRRSRWIEVNLAEGSIKREKWKTEWKKLNVSIRLTFKKGLILMSGQTKLTTFLFSSQHLLYSSLFPYIFFYFFHLLKSTTQTATKLIYQRKKNNFPAPEKKWSNKNGTQKLIWKND